MFMWMPGWGQFAVPVATHLLVLIVLLRHSFGVWSAVFFGLWLISLLWEMRRRWHRIGGLIPIVLPDSPLPYGQLPYGGTEPETQQLVRVRWSLPRWVSVELVCPSGRQVVDIFNSEMADHELAMLRRWAQLDKRPHRERS
jgi:hypothetical protein